MKTITSHPAMDVVDLEQEVIEITDTDCDWLNPARRIFCAEFKARRGDTLYNSVTPGNIWAAYERDGRADLMEALERADQLGHEKYWFNSDAVSLSSDRRARETWHLLREGQIVTMRGERFVIRVGHRGAVRLEAAPAPVEPVAAPVEPGQTAAPVAPRATLEQAALVAALELGPIRLGSLTLEKGATRYLMRDERSGKAHSLEISETSPRRLTAHWQGFVKNADVSHGEDVVILLPVNTPSGRRLFDCDKVAIIDALDQLASLEGHPLHGLEFRVHYSPSSVDGPATFWGDSEKIERANLAQVVADLIAARPPYRFTVGLPDRLTDAEVGQVLEYFAESWGGSPIKIERGGVLSVAGLSPDDPSTEAVSTDLARLIMGMDKAYHLAQAVAGDDLGWLAGESGEDLPRAVVSVGPVWNARPVPALSLAGVISLVSRSYSGVTLELGENARFENGLVIKWDRTPGEPIEREIRAALTQALNKMAAALPRCCLSLSVPDHWRGRRVDRAALAAWCSRVDAGGDFSLALSAAPGVKLSIQWVAGPRPSSGLEAGILSDVTTWLDEGGTMGDDDDEPAEAPTLN